MGPDTRHLPDFLVLGLILLAHWDFWRRCARYPKAWLLRTATVVSGVGLAFGLMFSIPRYSHLLPRRWWLAWALGLSIAWGMCVLGMSAAAAVARGVARAGPSRRKLVLAARTALLAAPFAVTGYGVFVERLRFRAREVDIALPGLDEDLVGLRLVQLSDIHLSPFLSEKDLARAVNMANEVRADVALVTGDLITLRGDPLDAGLRQLARLRADAGIYGCLGNHEIYAGCSDYAALMGERMGLRFLRDRAVPLKFGSGLINLAGVDYQRGKSTYLKGRERLVASGALNILLSHNPDVFPVAARMGFDLTIAGHTHGGQITLEFIHPDLTPVRFLTQYVYGAYQFEGRAAWVTRGLGTVGLPARLGAQPEIAIVRLVRGRGEDAGRA